MSYADSFNITTVFDGVEYKYIMYKGEENTKFDLVMSSPTLERNGSKVSIVVKSEDFYDFKNKIKEQLAYFTGVHFDVQGIDNNFQIIESEDWKYSTITDDDSMHLVLDNVYYPIDFGRLKLKPINLNVALNFRVSDGIMPTPSRESIKLIPSVKELIINKYNKVCQYFVDKYNDSITEAASILDVIDKIGNTKQVAVGGEIFAVSQAAEAIKATLKVPTVKGAPDVSIKDIADYRSCFLQTYNVVGQIRSGIYKGESGLDSSGIFNALKQGSKFILINEKPSKVLIDYLKFLYSSCYFVRYNPNAEMRLGVKDRYNSDIYYNILKLKDVPKSEWRNRIQQFQTIIKELTNRFVSIADVVPTQHWLDERKANRKRTQAQLVAKEEVRLKYAEHSNRSDFYASFPGWEIEDVTDLRKKKHFTVYGKPEQKQQLSILFVLGVLKEKYTFKVAMVSERDYNKLEKVKIHNFMSIEKFLNGEHKTFGDFCSLLKLDKIARKYKISSLEPSAIREFHTEFADQIVTVKKLLKLIGSIGSIDHEQIVKDMLALCEEQKLWDPAVEILTNNFEANAKKFSFIHQIKYATSAGYNSKFSYNDEQKEIIKEVLTARKVRMNPECYPAPVAPVVAETAENNEEPEMLLSDEQIQELNTIIADEIIEEELIPQEAFDF